MRKATKVGAAGKSWKGAGRGANWTRLRRAADPEIDQVVAAYHRQHPELTDPRDLVRSMIQELGKAKRDPQRFTRAAANPDGTWLTEALAIALAPPRWQPDPALIERGQRVFADYGLYQASALFFASLPMAYATLDGAAVLARVSDLATQNLVRRVAETGQMLLDVMGLRGGHSLDPGAPGYMTAVGLRLMHACVRVLVAEQPAPDPWPAAEFGPPANQELMLGTLLDFTDVAWASMARMGITLSEAEREANLHTWSFIGELMGVEACRDGPLSLGDVDQISTGMNRLLGPSEAGQRLMAALLGEMEEFMPLGWRKLPRSVVRWLFQDAPGAVSGCRTCSASRRRPGGRGRWQASLRAANTDSWLLGPLEPVARALLRKLGRHVLISYSDRYSNGQAPFRVPPELARRWGIRNTKVRGEIRQLRRKARHAARAGVRRLSDARSRAGDRHDGRAARHADHGHRAVHRRRRLHPHAHQPRRGTGRRPLPAARAAAARRRRRARGDLRQGPRRRAHGLVLLGHGRARGERRDRAGGGGRERVRGGAGGRPGRAQRGRRALDGRRRERPAGHRGRAPGRRGSRRPGAVHRPGAAARAGAGQHEFKDLGPVPAKGLGEPLQVCELRWQSGDRDPDGQVPPWLRNRYLLPFVGRSQELATLDDALRGARFGTRVIVLEGVSGTGKTRLASVLARKAARQGFTVLAGRCTDPPRQAYQPVAAAIEWLSHAAPELLLRAGLDEQCGPLARLAPSLTAPPLALSVPPAADPVTDRYQMLASLRVLVRRLTEVRPVLFVLDDLHWATPESIEMVRALSHDTEGMALLILAITRPVAAESAPVTARGLRKLEAESRRITLGSLSEQDVAQALAARPGQRSGPGAASPG